MVVNEILGIRLTPRKKDILIVTLWAAVISLVMIKTHWILYNTVEMFRAHPDWAFVVGSPPSLDLIDFAVLTASSIITILVLDDVKSMIYGYIVAHCIAFAIFVAYVFIYLWVIQGFHLHYSADPFGWEIVVWYGIVNMVYVGFPWVVGLSALGFAIGLIFRGIYMPSR